MKKKVILILASFFGLFIGIAIIGLIFSARSGKNGWTPSALVKPPLNSPYVRPPKTSPPQ